MAYRNNGPAPLPLITSYANKASTGHRTPLSFLGKWCPVPQGIRLRFLQEDLNERGLCQVVHGDIRKSHVAGRIKTIT